MVIAPRYFFLCSKMNFTGTDIGNFSRLDNLSHRQGKFLGPLLGFFLASIFPNLAIARLHHGSIKFQFDPVPSHQPNHPPSITIYEPPVPTWEPITKPPEELQLDPTGESEHHHIDVLSTNIESPSEYLVPEQSETPKVSVKRAIAPRYLTAYRRNRYSTRRRYPDYLEYDNYDYFTTPRLRNRKRNNGRRPIGFDYDYDYDYDYGKGQRRKQPRRKIKNNKRDPDFYSDDDFNDDVEPITTVLRPRQQQTTTPPTTTTTETTTMPVTTSIINGSTPATTITTTNTTTTTGYGYGPYSGNENISITYGPPSAIKPQYGVPGIAPGAPLSEWAPSYVYESPTSSFYSHPHSSYYSPGNLNYALSTSYHSPNSLYHSTSTSYHSPSTSYGSPSISYGSPAYAYGKPSSSTSNLSYGAPSSSYGTPSQSYGSPGSGYDTPSSSYGVPSSSTSYVSSGVSYSKPYATYSSSYGPPSTSYGVPQQSYGVPSQTKYQSYPYPGSSWYGRSASAVV